LPKLKGIIPIVNTTFREDGGLDLHSQLRLVQHLIDQGVHAIALFGNAGEGYALSESERDELLSAIIKEVRGRVPVVVSTGHSGTDAAVQISRAAENAGADALMILPPSFIKPDSQGIFAYYAAISDAVRIPIMVQDAPLMTQLNMPSSLIARMGRELEHIEYAKIEAPPTAPKITELVAEANGSIVAFGGLNGNFLIEELDRGAQGIMPGSDLCAAFVNIWDLYQNGGRVAARAEFRKYLPLIRYELQPGLGVSVMKHNLVAEGVIKCARVRHPTRTIDAAALKEISELRSEIRTSIVSF
jgi:2-keto-3-deoxy-L-arabinonate dehydratase